MLPFESKNRKNEIFEFTILNNYSLIMSSYRIYLWKSRFYYYKFRPWLGSNPETYITNPKTWPLGYRSILRVDTASRPQQWPLTQLHCATIGSERWAEHNKQYGAGVVIEASTLPLPTSVARHRTIGFDLATLYGTLLLHFLHIIVENITIIR